MVSLGAAEAANGAAELTVAAGAAVSLFATLAGEAVLGEEKAAAVFTDPPYNVKVDGHVCGGVR